MSQTTVELNSTPRKAHKRTFLPRQIVVESYRSSESYLSFPNLGLRGKNVEEEIWHGREKKKEEEEKWKASTVKNYDENKRTRVRQVNA